MTDNFKPTPMNFKQNANLQQTKQNTQEQETKQNDNNFIHPQRLNQIQQNYKGQRNIQNQGHGYSYSQGQRNYFQGHDQRQMNFQNQGQKKIKKQEKYDRQKLLRQEKKNLKQSLETNVPQQQLQQLQQLQELQQLQQLQEIPEIPESVQELPLKVKNKQQEKKQEKKQTIKQEKKLKNFNPKVDLIDYSNVYIIRMEIPGLNIDDLNVELQNDQLLCVSGNKVNEKFTDQEYKSIYTECRFGNFKKEIKLPSKVESLKKFNDNGVFYITLDKIDAFAINVFTSTLFSPFEIKQKKIKEQFVSNQITRRNSL